MFGTDTKKMDDKLYYIVSNLFCKYNNSWLMELKKITDLNISLKLLRNVPYRYISETQNFFGWKVGVNTITDSGEEKMNKTDGGVIFINIQYMNNNVKLPLIWVETKSSNSCTTNNGQRGQATGLITESAERCREWTSPIDNIIKPLVAIMTGTDFNKDRGTYNIDRITTDLHTLGNLNPYQEEQDIKKTKGVAWLYYKENFDESELESIMLNIIKTNIEKMKTILINFTSFID